MATVFTVLVLIFTYVITASTLSIFDVTEKVLGLREADFKSGGWLKPVVLSRMDSKTRYKYETLKRRDRGAFGFMETLYGNADSTSVEPWRAEQALINVVNYYKSMTVDQLNILHRLFPVVETIFSHYRST